MLSNWNREIDVDLLVDTLGNIPADMMNLTYLMLKPWRLFAQKYVGMVDILDDRKAMEDFLRMEKWIFDSPDQAGEAFREFNTQFFQGNGFVKGGVRVGEEDVHLGLVEMPILNIYAEQDHLVPPDASRALKGGHIGIYVSGRAQKEVPDTIHAWLAKRSR
jgi:polyhydroxyalkanoate synthase